jgi:O-antigen/teichoic acid export membrane protein
MSSAAPASPSSARGLFKDLAQGSGIYLLGFVAQRLAGILMVPITTRCLTPADYGMADLIEQTTTVLSILLGLNLSSALGYFYFQNDSAESRRAVANTTVLGALSLGALAMLICEPFSAVLAQLVFRDASAGRYFRIVFFAFPASFAMDAMFSLIRVENRPVTYTLMSGLRLSLQIAGVIVLVALLQLHLTGMAYASLTGATVTAAVMGIYRYHRLRPAFDFRVFVRIVKYAAPLGLSGVAMFFIHVGDRFLLPHYRPLSELGIYVLAYKVGTLLSFMYGSFQLYWNAQVFGIMRREDATSVFARTFTYLILGLSFCGLGLIIGSRPALRIMAAPAFQGAAGLVPFIVIAYYMRAIGDFLRCLFLVQGRPGYDAVCNWLGAGACVAGYFTLIPRFGIWGAAYATVFAFSVIAIVAIVWTYRVRPYHVETARLFKIGAASVATIVPYYAIRVSSLPALICLATLSLSMFPLMLWLLRFPTAGELEVALRALSRVRRKVLRRG